MPMIELEGTFDDMVHKAMSNKKVEALVIASNNVIKANGKATLPAEVTHLIPVVWHKMPDGHEVRSEIRERLAGLMKTTNKHKVQLLGRLNGTNVVTLPTKNHWRDSEDLSLIREQTKMLVKGINKRGWKFVAMMRPVMDDSTWDTFKEEFSSILKDTQCRIGVFSGKKAAEQPKPKKALKDMDDEERKEFYRQRALKAAATRKRKQLEKEKALQAAREAAAIAEVENELR